MGDSPPKHKPKPKLESSARGRTSPRNTKTDMSIPSLGESVSPAAGTSTSSSASKSASAINSAHPSVLKPPKIAPSDGTALQIPVPYPSSKPSATPSPSVSPGSQHGTVVGRNDRRRFVCTHPDCDKTFSTSGHLARHTRVHTGEKQFKCTYPDCESRFSRHDNMLQHYRNHIVRNARRKKKIFAEVVASGQAANLARGTVGDPNSASSSAAAPYMYNMASARTPHEPIFIHSAYSTGGTSTSSSTSSQAGKVKSSAQSVHRRRPSPYSEQPRDTATARSTPSRPPNLNLNLGLLHPVMAFQDDPSSNMSPPLASPSAIERPHSAIAPGPGLAYATTMPEPPTLTHRHSYSTFPTLGSIHAHYVDPVTPASELAMYPAMYPISPLEPHPPIYSPSLTDSPHLTAHNYFTQDPMTYYPVAHPGVNALVDQYQPLTISGPMSADVEPYALSQGHSRQHTSSSGQSGYHTDGGSQGSLGHRNPLLSGVIASEPTSAAGSPVMHQAVYSANHESHGFPIASGSSASGSDAGSAPSWLRRPAGSTAEDHVWQPQLASMTPESPMSPSDPQTGFASRTLAEHHVYANPNHPHQPSYYTMDEHYQHQQHQYQRLQNHHLQQQQQLLDNEQLTYLQNEPNGTNLQQWQTYE